MNMPSTYIEGIPRVSSIVDAIYPFTWEAKKRFEKWLSSKQVSIETYMDVAQKYWTAIHLWLEGYIIGNNVEQEKYEPHLTKYVSYGIQFLQNYKVISKGTEVYVRTEDYQGTIDLIGEMEGEDWVLDWKTWWIAQEVLNTKKADAIYKKPYDKIKKATLQLSLYAHAKWIGKIWIVELATDGYHFHPLKIIPKDEITLLITNNIVNIWAQKNE